MSFKTLGLSHALLAELAAQQFTQPYPIQLKAIPAILEKRDVLGIAGTGSGKTASYVLPILTNLQKVQTKKDRHIHVLVLVPTRELAKQVNEVFRTFAQGFKQKIRSSAVFGGVSINPQMMGMQHVDVLVATPGRLLQLVRAHAVHFSELKTLVLDEADKLLNAEFTDEMNQILEILPHTRQNLLYSATLTDTVKQIHQILLHDPLIIKIESEESDIELIEQKAYMVADSEKGPLLRYLIREQKMKQVLVFASSIARADRVAEKLRKHGIEARSIHRKKSQGARTDLLTKFKHGKLPVLVATDLLGRGIDIEYLPYVINYELPRSPKMFIHRIGRTGRAQRHGKAISLISPEEENHFWVIEKKMNKHVEKIKTDDIDLSRV
ncbi:MAG: DEAD/DEAH box helicase [Spirochaetia bacterium]|nr:DEAD/DEAH box helicase [Spirochaetia bacterium]